MSPNVKDDVKVSEPVCEEVIGESCLGPRSGPYLEYSGNTVEGKEETPPGPSCHLEVKAVGCKCRFCKDCCRQLGRKLRERLMPAIKQFGSAMMLTLTIDPKLFPDPATAYWYCKKRRAIAELVKGLWRGGHLASKKFFCVVEWHLNGWAHFHLLVESNRIPFIEIAKLWGRNRPRSAPAWEGNYSEDLKGQEPEFGTVRFSKAKFECQEHAANYLLKYLTKMPERGYPDWVLESKQQIRMYATSRGLLPARSKSKPKKKPPKTIQLQDLQNSCPCGDGTCDKCQQLLLPLSVKPAKIRKPTTIRQRLDRCGTKAVLIEVTETPQFGNPKPTKEFRFLELLRVEFKDARKTLGWEDVGQRSVRVLSDQLSKLSVLCSPASLIEPSALENLKKRGAA